MKQFMEKDFLLSTKTAQALYHEAAAEEGIFDYHCHLEPREIGENRRFSNLTELWLGGDHYKWRALRSNGIEERLITGDADPYDRFLAWADTVPRLIGNPLYHWTHLELQRYFDIYEPLDRESAPAIWKAANEKLEKDAALSVYGIFRRFKVYGLGTTDDPADTLEWHRRIREAGDTETLVLPSFRPDLVLTPDAPTFAEAIRRLGAAAGRTIESLGTLLAVLRERLDHFEQAGCRSADHGMAFPPLNDLQPSEGETGEIFARLLAGKGTTFLEREAYRALVLRFLGAEYQRRGWVMQLHFGALRNANSRMLRSLGPNTGFDVIGDYPLAEALVRLLDSLEPLPRTVLYSLNPRDYYVLGAVMGAFQGEGRPGKVQLGSAWWFNDHRDGMEEQLKVLGNLGLLSSFVGMLTDSRSFLSYPRHEYFRRILCNMLGTWAEEGEIPHDLPRLKGMVRDIAFRNAKGYFGV